MKVAKELLEELVTANRILAREDIVDSFGHVSIRHPGIPDHYLMSRARAPECIDVDDLMEFTRDGAAVDAAGRKAYAERFIHGAVYEMRPDVLAVVHHHSHGVIPFGVTGMALRPLIPLAAAIGADVPTWDSRTSFGDTSLLVTNMAMARDLAATLGTRTVALMRGHGCVVAGGSLREVVLNSVYLNLNADLQMQAHALGEVTFLSQGEIQAVLETRGAFTYERAWERWCRRAGRPYDVRPMEGPLADLV